MATYTSVHLAKRPKASIVPGETFTLKTDNPIPSAADLKENEVIIQTNYLSLDPAMRGWLNDTRSYIPPVPVGGVMRGVAVGKIVASKSAKYEMGTYVSASTGWSEYAILDAKECQPVDIPEGGKLTDALGVLGMTGMTAYFGLLDIGNPKPGELVVVTGAAGATGSVVGQIAKIKGARVLGIAGGEDKCRWLKEELGFDEAIDYKGPEFKEKFREATKGFIDVFFDNVGGEVLDMALGRAKPHARFVMCGGISQYNSSEVKGPKNYLNIISMRIRMEGFIVFDYVSQFKTARAEIAKWLSEGKLKRKETIVKGGLAKAEEALLGLYQGGNTGKLLVEVRPVDQEGKSKI